MWAAISKLLTSALKSPALASWLPTLIIDKVLKPVFLKLYKWLKNKIEKRKQKKEVWAKYKNYSKSDNSDEFNNTFDDLP